jgi:hypothetical protein
MKKIYFLFTFLITALSFGQTPIITAILDGDCTGGNPKLLEIYADGAVDFTLYSLENQTNANTTWGATQDLSSFGTVTNDFVYITTTGSLASIATEFPSLASTTILESNTMNLNGDDRVRIVLTADTTVIDQFGAEATDGSGTAWDYTDSFAKRIDGTGPDAGFTEVNWTYGGAGFLNLLGVCQGGADTFETLIGGIGTYNPTASSDPTISMGGTVTGLDYFEGEGPSAEGTFNVSGINLTANITVTAPTNFEVSLSSGAGFGPSVSVTQTAGTAPTTTVYVRLAAGLSANSYNGDVTATSTGATNATVAVSGTVSPAVPQITITGTVDALTYAIGNGPSSEDSFNVEGLFLTQNITVSAPANFEVSLTSGSGFGSSVSVTQTGGTAALTEVFVRLASGLAEGPYSGDISASSTGATTQNLSLTGNVFGAATNALVITGAYDGPLSGGTPKGIELYALEDIADLSLFGISVASNGTGSSNGTIAYTFPADAVSAGTFIYLATESPQFTAFFGFAPTYTSGVLSINGDDAIELYENGQIIDTFGTVDCDPNASGTACPEWDHLDGWGYRNDDTGPDGGFVLANWYFSGANQLENGATNAECTVPFPIGTYQNTLSVGDATITNFSIYPNPTSTGYVNITSTNADAMSVAVFDVLGKQVINETISNNRLDVSSLNTGLYIVKISQNNATVTKKLVIK